MEVVDDYIRHSNPWADEGPNQWSKILQIAEKTGHLKRKLRVNSVTGGYDEDVHCVSVEVRNKSPSLRLIQQLKHIDAMRKELNKINLEIQLRLQDKETRDLTHQTIQEERIKKISTLTAHLESVTNQKDQLLSRLQQPFVGDYLKVEAPYHKYACEIFPQVVSMLSDLTKSLQDIQWASNANVKDGKLEGALDTVSGQLISLQAHFQSSSHMRSLMEQMHTQQVMPL